MILVTIINTADKKRYQKSNCSISYVKYSDVYCLTDHFYEYYPCLFPYHSILWHSFFSGDPKKRKKRKLHHIGFAVYEVPPHMTRLTPLYVAEHVSWCCKQILISQVVQERIRTVWSKVSNLRSSKELFTKTISRIFSKLLLFWFSKTLNKKR